MQKDSKKNYPGLYVRRDTPMSISVFRALSVTLTVALVFSTAAPALYAQTATSTDDGRTAEERLCERDGGVWSTSCDMPSPPADVCPNVPGDQGVEPCADAECTASGGTWNGASCDMPPPPPADSCPNIDGVQEV